MTQGLRNWYVDTREVYERSGSVGLLYGLYYTYVGMWLTATTRMPVGTNVFAQDWDACIVLDACRTDALAAVADEYDFVESVGAITSVGSTSGEWFGHTFDQRYSDEIAECAYVTANPHSRAVLEERNTPPQYFAAPITWPKWNPVGPSAFQRLEEVWKTAHSERLDVTPPRPTTDTAIDVGRETDPERLLVHYMQPHAPYIRDYVDEPESPEPELTRPFEHLREGTLSRERAWEGYLDNLRLVLDEVELLLENLDADRVVVTADHGEAFGEFSFYEHPVGCPHPVVKRVPWVETTATDTETYRPASEATAETEETTETSVEDQLVALGYR